MSHQSKNGKVISFINMKGGVGKTTLCIGIGEYLANFKEKKVLFIDLDPQFNTTQSIMDLTNNEEEYMEDFRHRITIRKVFEDTKTISERPKLPDVSEVILNFETEPNIDLICGTIDIIKDDTSNKSLYKRLSKFINEHKLKEKYDFILIDCPPTISFYTDAALYASDYYIVPAKVDRYSILGVKMLKTVVENLKYDEEIDITPLGIVYTMRKQGDETKKTGEIRSRFESDEDVSQIGIFENSTLTVNDLMVGYQGNISSKYIKSKEDIEKVTEEFLLKIAATSNGRDDSNE
ncbi:chromosome partitioning protein ParA [Bacillus thuringiensis]|uniref:ParA family protein n=1 Tax=Bacillus cereus group TaxID=86661 RepID=UPI000BF305A4|nr:MULTISPECIES: AAA family ATPase [Bacillus cereus group]PFC04499.1 chromosome partitioning protein ParA [Bacillus thuringiensis]PFC16263.1 chromosome partitioning protein ParA [Bacillus thuringiensis]PFD64931.1 chromosome partitioning protein ParA [Bacillus thuringiensis]PFO40701.1 chromosome partitioning protein ParA [Bacillus thuringiensis]PGO87088.1 chromosome partitioning protein ParA [Bacillus thuringiensis]